MKHDGRIEPIVVPWQDPQILDYHDPIDTGPASPSRLISACAGGGGRSELEEWVDHEPLA
jgi:hypothetical protein